MFHFFGIRWNVIHILYLIIWNYIRLNWHKLCYTYQEYLSMFCPLRHLSLFCIFKWLRMTSTDATFIIDFRNNSLSSVWKSEELHPSNSFSTFIVQVIIHASEWILRYLYVSRYIYKSIHQLTFNNWHLGIFQFSFNTNEQIERHWNESERFSFLYAR